MKATCPICQRSYRVEDEKVPDTGAQIKCPKCGTMFVVRKPPPPTNPPAPQAPAEPPQDASRMRIPLKHEQATPLQALMGQEVPDKATPGDAGAPQPSSSTPDMDRLSGEQEISSPVPGREEPRPAPPAARARGMSAIRAQSGARPAADQPPASDLLESWRVRTARGLTYDFPSREALQKWLAGREDPAGCQVAAPGGDWGPAEPYLGGAGAAPAAEVAPEATAQPSPGAPSMFPTHVPPGQPLQPAPKMGVEATASGRPMLARRTDVLGWLLGTAAVLSTIAVLLVAAASLTRYGLVDFSPILPLERVGIVYPSGETREQTRPAPDAVVPQDPEAVFRQALRAANRALRAKRFSKAALEYNRALGIHPGSVPALEGIAKAYNGLGDRDRALAALKKARSIGSR